MSVVSGLPWVSYTNVQSLQDVQQVFSQFKIYLSLTIISLESVCVQWLTYPLLGTLIVFLTVRKSKNGQA